MTRELKPCGTPAAYARHLRHREPPCDACTAAQREHSAAQRREAAAARRETALALARRAELAAAVYTGRRGAQAARRAAALRGEL